MKSVSVMKVMVLPMKAVVRVWNMEAVVTAFMTKVPVMELTVKAAMVLVMKVVGGDGDIDEGCSASVSVS